MKVRVGARFSGVLAAATIGLGLGAAVLSGASPSAAIATQTVRVSALAAGGPSGATSAVMAASGSTFAFTSTAAFVPGPAISRVLISNSGVITSISPTISATRVLDLSSDGRFVLYETSLDVRRYDRVNNVDLVVSVLPSGMAMTNVVVTGAMDDTGNHVVLKARTLPVVSTTNPVPIVTQPAELYAVDLSGAVPLSRLLKISPTGALAEVGAAVDPLTVDLTPDGTTIFFGTTAPVSSVDTNAQPDWAVGPFNGGPSTLAIPLGAATSSYPPVLGNDGLGNVMFGFASLQNLAPADTDSAGSADAYVVSLGGVPRFVGSGLSNPNSPTDVRAGVGLIVSETTGNKSLTIVKLDGSASRQVAAATGQGLLVSRPTLSGSGTRTFFLTESAAVVEDTNGAPDAYFTDQDLPVAGGGDSVPPVVVGSATPSANGFVKIGSVIDWVATDPSPSSGTPTDPPNSAVAGQGNIVSSPSCDPAGNCATGMFVANVDAQVDMLSALCPTPGTIGDSATIRVFVRDFQSGVDSVSYVRGGITTPVVFDPMTGSVDVALSGLGNQPVVVNFIALDRLGNRKEFSCTMNLPSEYDVRPGVTTSVFVPGVPLSGPSQVTPNVWMKPDGTEVLFLTSLEPISGQTASGRLFSKNLTTGVVQRLPINGTFNLSVSPSLRFVFVMNDSTNGTLLDRSNNSTIPVSFAAAPFVTQVMDSGEIVFSDFASVQVRSLAGIVRTLYSGMILPYTSDGRSTILRTASDGPQSVSLELVNVATGGVTSLVKLTGADAAISYQAFLYPKVGTDASGGVAAIFASSAASLAPGKPVRQRTYMWSQATGVREVLPDVTALLTPSRIVRGRILFSYANAQVVLYDPALSTRLQLVSVSNLGEKGDGPSYGPSINDDGTLVAFQSDSRNFGIPMSPGSSMPYIRTYLPPDAVAPVVTGFPSRAPDLNGWYRSNVTIDWRSVDPLPSSGTPSDPADTVASTEGTVRYVSPPSCDPSGNCATGSLELSVDTRIDTLSVVCPSAILDPRALPENESEELSSEGIPSRPSWIVQGNASDSTSGLTKLEWALDNGAPVALTPVNGAFQLNLPRRLELGSHTVAVRAWDKAGNQRQATCLVDRFRLPGRVLGLRVTGGDRRVDVQWSTPMNTGGGISGYVAELRTGSVVIERRRLGVGVLSTAFVGLRNGTAYLVAVSAETPAGLGRAATGETIPQPVVTVTSARASESGVLVFTVNLSSPSVRPVQLQWRTIDGSARSGGRTPDYIADGGVAVVPPSATSVVFRVRLVNDRIREPEENLSVEINVRLDSVPPGRTPSIQAIGVIVDDD